MCLMALFSVLYFSSCRKTHRMPSLSLNHHQFMQVAVALQISFHFIPVRVIPAFIMLFNRFPPGCAPYCKTSFLVVTQLSSGLSDLRKILCVDAKSDK